MHWAFAASIVALANSAGAVPDEQPMPSEEKIVITGERVARTLRQTSSSVVVMTQREIESTSSDRVDELLAAVPNLQLGSGTQGPSIRGFDTTGALQNLPAFLGGNRPRTALVVDGRTVSYNEFVFGTAPVWDLDRIEVFRSPQTTTQGQNSIAGAIFVYSNDPSFEDDARVRLISGNFEAQQVSALVNTRLSEDAAFRLSGDFRYSRTTSRIVDRAEGGDPNHDVFGLLRAKLLIQPRAIRGTRLLLTYTHNQSQAPQIVGLTAPFRRRRDNFGFYGTFQIGVDALTAKAHAAISDHLSANVTLSGGKSDVRRLAYPGLGEAHIRGGDWAGEATLDWATDAVHAVGGFRRTHQTLHQRIDLSQLSGIGEFGDQQNSVGLFAETAVRLTRHISLTTGLRYQEDRQIRRGALGGANGPIPLAYDRTFRVWLPKISLAVDLSSRVRGGVLVQRAYNPGGTTLRFDMGAPDNFAAEQLWDCELFLRANLPAGLSASANLFYEGVHDAQRASDILIFTPAGLGVGFSDLFNAHRARSSGAEANLEWRASRALTARFSLGLLRTRLIDGGPDHPELSGNSFARSPHLSASAAVDWTPTKQLHLSIQARHHSAFYAQDVNSPDVRIAPASILDIRAEYRIRRVNAFAYVRNLFNSFALLDREGSLRASAEDPRTIGMGIETRF